MKRLSGSERALAKQMGASDDLELTISVKGSRWRDVLGVAVRILLGLALGIAIWQVMAMTLNAKGSTLGFPYPLETFERLGEYLFAGKSLYGHSIYDHILASISRLTR